MIPNQILLSVQQRTSAENSVRILPTPCIVLKKGTCHKTKSGHAMQAVAVAGNSPPLSKGCFQFFWQCSTSAYLGDVSPEYPCADTGITRYSQKCYLQVDYTTN